MLFKVGLLGEVLNSSNVRPQKRNCERYPPICREWRHEDD